MAFAEGAAASFAWAGQPEAGNLHVTVRVPSLFCHAANDRNFAGVPVQFDADRIGVCT
jgi:hypothetical protein